MSDFPTYTRSAKKGEKGIGLVSTIINDKYNWLFKRNHQEHDFGIDGQIEVITAEGPVTGQMLAAQIKHGTSFFGEKNRWGWIYRGERKHFNYLSNYPVPVLIIICEPDTGECYWAHFVPLDTEETEKGWKLTIPFSHRLGEDRSKIDALLSPLKDVRSELQSFWALNKIIMGSELILCALSRAVAARLGSRIQLSFFVLTSISTRSGCST